MEYNSKRQINLNLPPGATPLNPEELDDLLPKHIKTRNELNDAEFINISEASKKYLLSKKKFQFTVGNLYKVHNEMFNNVWKWAGKRRKTNTNIGVDKENIDIELKKLIDDLDYWLQHDMETIEISARLHHRLVQIHPFHNGNGRWARFIINLFLKDELNSYLDFPEDEIIITTTVRSNYIRALQKADDLNFQSLINLHLKYLSTFK